MSDLIIKRKSEVSGYIENSNIKNRIEAFFKNDDKKIEAFKANVIKLSINNSLSKCNVATIFQSALNLAELDLDLNPMMGLAYVVSYGKDAQACIGYKGYLALAERAGKLIKASSVFECDKFSLNTDGFNDVVNFEPNFDDREEDNKEWYNNNFKGVLIRIKDLSSGEVFIHFVSSKKIYKISGISPSKNSNFSPYANWYQEMHLAKAIKYILSKTPISNEISRAIEIDNEIDIKESQNYIKEQTKSIDIAKSIIEKNSTETDIDVVEFDTTTGEVVE